MRLNRMVLVSGMVVMMSLGCAEVQEPVGTDPISEPAFAAAKAGGGSLADLLAAAAPHLAAAQAHSNSHGAMFIELPGTFGFIFFDPFPSFCAVTLPRSGDGSFYRLNPDGTLTIKLSGASDIGYTPSFFTGPFYNGQGNGQIHMTGQPTFFEPIPGLVFIFVDPPFRGETLVHAVGEVIEDGTTGPSSQLRCNLHLDRDGTIKKREVVFR